MWSSPMLVIWARATSEAGGVRGKWYRRRSWVSEDVRAVQIPSYPDLEYPHVDTLLDERVDPEDGQHVEVRERRERRRTDGVHDRPEILREELLWGGHACGKRHVGQRHVVDPDTLLVLHKVRAREEPRAKTAPAEDRLGKRASRPLPFRPGHVDDLQLVEIGLLDPKELEVWLVLLERGQGRDAKTLRGSPSGRKGRVRGSEMTAPHPYLCTHLAPLMVFPRVVVPWTGV